MRLCTDRESKSLLRLRIPRTRPKDRLMPGSPLRRDDQFVNDAK